MYVIRHGVNYLAKLHLGDWRPVWSPNLAEAFRFKNWKLAREIARHLNAEYEEPAEHQSRAGDERRT